MFLTNQNAETVACILLNELNTKTFLNSWLITEHATCFLHLAKDVSKFITIRLSVILIKYLTFKLPF